LIEIVEGSGLDVAAIMPVMHDAFNPGFGEAWTAAQCLSTLAMPGSHLLIAKNGNETVGFALSRGVVDEEELLLIGVLRTTHRQGVGRQLITKLSQICIELGRSVIFLEVREGNSANSFYEYIGFNPVGRRPNYYRSADGSKYDSITMALSL
jgi:[ribosomal protein S18]-alanine N-acetyltransferase